MNIKYFLKTNKFTKAFYPQMRANYYRWRSNYYRRKYLTGRYRFINRSKNSDKLCIVLAGYKDFLMPAVMGRIFLYAPENLDVCIITSGKWSDEIEQLCKDNHWSYLSTERNNVSLAQNIAINLHPSANYIFKLDEDIFVTKDYFERMLDAYDRCKEYSDYNVGVLAPLLPINGYGHVKIIKKFGIERVYERVYGDLKYASGTDRQIEANSDLAKFMWGEPVIVDGKEYRLPGIDEMNLVLSRSELEFEACPIRFSIGAILFEREFWENMDYFHVGKGNDLGNDEIQICEVCMLKSKPLIVCNNIVAGHLSFGKQNQVMKNYYEHNKAKFFADREEFL